jgi:hypothetical protein
VVEVAVVVIAQTLLLLLQHPSPKASGGGGGRLLKPAFTATFGTAYTVTVGAGGAGQACWLTSINGADGNQIRRFLLSLQLVGGGGTEGWFPGSN